MPKPSAYIPTLDGWRAMAIALVVCSHSSDSMAYFFQIQDQNLIQWMKNIGLFGVKIFFGLSGFLITTNLLNEEQRGGAISLKSFYIRRIFRILPVSLIFIFVVGVLISTDIVDTSWSRWFSTLFLMANYSTAPGSWYMGHFWSLAVEEHFYLLWPAFFFYLNNSKKRIVFVFLSAILIALWRAVDFKFRITSSDLAMFWGRTDIQVDNIMWGVFLALIYNNELFRNKLKFFYSNSNQWLWFFVLLLIFQFFPGLGWKSDFFRLSIVALLIPLLILGTVINHAGIFGKLLELPLVRWLGKISFSLYLWQQLFLVAADAAVPGLRDVQVFPVNVLAALALATGSYFLIERPFIKFGHRLLHGRSAFSLKAGHV